ncbi:MAG: hypothetical protein MJ202_02230 [Lentisphaeria bacterium]|nr:hypothetical protein [Lentisphaeria bacterium]
MSRTRLQNHECATMAANGVQAAGPEPPFFGLRKSVGTDASAALLA